MLISVIVPVFNEELVIGESYKRLGYVMMQIQNSSFELIFINDGSKDRTLEILRDISSQDAHVKVINFSRNFGHQAAVTAGINECLGDIAIIIDADLQDPPEVIPEMIRVYMEQKCNVVYGVRRSRKGEGRFKKLSAKIFYRLLNHLSDVSFPVDTGDFRLIDQNIIRVFNSMHEKNKYIRGLISWVGFSQKPVFYEREPRFAGETKYPIWKMIKFASTGLFYFSKKPLQIATSIGFFSIIIGLSLAIWLLLNGVFKMGYVVTGWTSTIIVIIFFGGVQLLTIGVLGQYIGSLFDEVKNRPEYIIADKINFSTASQK